MRQWHYYHADSGEFHSKIFKCDAGNRFALKDAAANAPPGHVLLEGRYPEHWRMRVDVTTRAVVPK